MQPSLPEARYKNLASIYTQEAGTDRALTTTPAHLDQFVLSRRKLRFAVVSYRWLFQLSSETTR
jgi:hypothetical protein